MSPGTHELLPDAAPDAIVRASQTFLDPATLAVAQQIVDDVRVRGIEGLREHAERLGDIRVEAPLILGRTDFDRALQSMAPEDRACLERCATRIRDFAQAQRSALRDLDHPIPGGAAGHRFVPVETAGCYAPGGRFPLPSSVLMTAVTARVAGVPNVVVASPRPSPWTLAAAGVAGADAMLAVGGAQAIAALAFGIGDLPPADLLCGPGNRYVTAAKKILAGEVGIDMLAGPSELVVVADASADPRTVAADLLAQAEHDEDARVALITVDEPGFAERVRRALGEHLADHPGSEAAARSLCHGRAVDVADLDAAVGLCDRLAPEHLQLCVQRPEHWTGRLQHYGALFTGAAGAEVFGDYGAGPNHVLPTGGASRHSGGLSVATFLRLRTWLHLDHAERGLVEDTERLAGIEGLHGHATAARIRRSTAR
ncbi:MAG: histidinol dehydrogenase [Planctomycetota bacterium]|nr:histidinol dehydrogenase [Planctomycetota bacterium]MDA0934994.1 histidinol dehydrogenase [Planctomycetota bacterium]